MLIILSAICTESGAVRRMSAEPECFHKDAHYFISRRVSGLLALVDDYSAAACE
jgi:hypothetical protein